jgi:hypothetical protein
VEKEKDVKASAQEASQEDSLAKETSVNKYEILNIWSF